MHQARKRFGQHFLRDQQVIEKIIQFLMPKSQDNIIEIGPGLGALTIPLIKQHSPLTVIELDKDVIPHLKSNCSAYGELIVYQEDVLTTDFSQLANGKNMRIVGNLPYNISTPLLFHLLTYKAMIQDMLFMLQKEVVDRLAANVNTPEYGRLSIMLQSEFTITPLFTVMPIAFSPPPKVDSAVVYFIPHDGEKYGKIQQKPLFSAIVREAFQYRRKMLRKALAKYFTESMLEECHIDGKCRPQELTISQYVTLSNYRANLGKLNV